MPEDQSILIVEDESIVALDLRQQLLELGYRIQGVAASGEEATRLVAKQVPDLVLMDVRLQGSLDGIEVAKAIRSEHDVPVIFLTSHSDDETVRRAASTAPYGYLTKPYQIRELRAGIEVALTKARLERQLREADRWFASTLQCVTDGVLVTDQDARIRFLNPAAERLTGWTRDDAIGREVGDVVRILPQDPVGHDADATPQAAHRYEPTSMIRAVLQLGRPAPAAFALQLQSHAGGTTVIDEIVGPVDDDSGRRLGAVVVLRDVSLRMAQEALLRSSEERFRSAFDHAPLGMALVSLSGRILQVNGALCRLLGQTAETLRREDHANLIVEADREHEVQRLHELMTAEENVVQYERRYRRPGDDEPVSTLVSVSLLREGGQPTCYLFQVHDLTAQKAAAGQLAELAAERIKRQTSELASADKSEFLSRVSHEMRTPLNAVIGFASLLQLRGGTAAANSGVYAHHIQVAGEHLLAIVTDLIDLDRAVDGTLKMDPQPVRLDAKVEESIQMLSELIQRHGIELRSSVAADLVVVADPVRLLQVLLNVISNAIKYNRPGGSVWLRADATDGGRIRLAIEDKGIGMTQEQLDRLFRPFDRLGQERTKTPGSGLGLVISQGLVNQMGGALLITSEPRVGTTVRIELPAAA